MRFAAFSRRADAAPRSLLVAVLAVLVAAAGMICVASGPAQAAPRSPAAAVPRLVWSKPVKLEKAPFVNGVNLVFISCPSASFCAASDANGNVVTSSHPAGGSGGWSAATPVAPLQFRQLVISCPAARFCAARQDRTIYTSSSPGGRQPIWRPSFSYQLPIGPFQCPSVHLCLAVAAGKVITSTDPAARRPSWRMVSLSRTIRYPSCPSVSFCAGLAGGDVLTSSHPAGGRSAWKVTNVDGAAQLSNLACASAAFCLAFDGLGRIVYSTDPAGGASHWHFSAAAPSDANLTEITCLSASFCAARDRSEAGSIAVTTSPSHGLVPWQETVANGAAIEGVSCAKPSFCALATDHGFVASTSSPAAPSPHWSSSNVDGYTPITDVGCASAKLCLAADTAGKTYTSVSPTGGAGAWRAAHIDGTNLISSITCPTASFCAAAGSDGNLLTSTDPAGGAASDWQKISVPSGLSDVSCQTRSFCAGTDGTGLLTSTNPSGGGPAWKQGTGVPALTYLTCPSSHLCAGIAVGHLAHELITTADPAAAAPQLTTTFFSSYRIFKLDCPSAALCVAVGSDNAGRLFFFSSTHPTGGITAWRVSKAPAIGLLACPSARECVVLESNLVINRPGAMFTSTDPGAKVPAWHETVAPLDLVSISCPAAALCVGAYYVGNSSPSVSGGIKTAVPAHGS